MQGLNVPKLASDLSNYSSFYLKTTNYLKTPFNIQRSFHSSEMETRNPMKRDYLQRNKIVTLVEG